jgi:hypothetical protein
MDDFSDFSDIPDTSGPSLDVFDAPSVDLPDSSGIDLGTDSGAVDSVLNDPGTFAVDNPAPIEIGDPEPLDLNNYPAIEAEEALAPDTDGLNPTSDTFLDPQNNFTLDDSSDGFAVEPAEQLDMTPLPDDTAVLDDLPDGFAVDPAGELDMAPLPGDTTVLDDSPDGFAVEPAEQLDMAPLPSDTAVLDDSPDGFTVDPAEQLDMAPVPGDVPALDDSPDGFVVEPGGELDIAPLPGDMPVLDDSPDAFAIEPAEQLDITPLPADAPVLDDSPDGFAVEPAEQLDIAPLPGDTPALDDSADGYIVPETQEQLDAAPPMDGVPNPPIEPNTDTVDTHELNDLGIYEQGHNSKGFEGTCGPTTIANTLNLLEGKKNYTEENVLDAACNGFCATDMTPEYNGGMRTSDMLALYAAEDPTLDTKCFDENNALNPEQIAQEIESGKMINVSVDAETLWDWDDSANNPFYNGKPEVYSDHWITVWNAERKNGEITGFNIIDSGGGESYVDIDKFNSMYYGTDSKKILDPTCLVISKK